MFTRSDMGWLWLIPLSDTVMSVGAVIPRVIHRQQAQATAEASLAHYLADTPLFCRCSSRHGASLRRASMPTTPTWPPERPGPLGGGGRRGRLPGSHLSTGVLLAMQGGLEAAEAVDVGLRAGDLSARAFTGTSVSSGSAITTSGGSPSGSMTRRSVSCGSRPGSDSASTPRSWPSSPGTGGLHCDPGQDRARSSPWSPCSVSPWRVGVLDVRAHHFFR